MNCFVGSDLEFENQLKLLNKGQLEELGSIFEKRYNMMRAEYQIKKNAPREVPASVLPLGVAVPASILPTVSSTPSESVMAVTSASLPSPSSTLSSLSPSSGRYSPRKSGRSSGSMSPSRSSGSMSPSRSSATQITLPMNGYSVAEIPKSPRKSPRRRRQSN